MRAVEQAEAREAAARARRDAGVAARGEAPGGRRRCCNRE